MIDNNQTKVQSINPEELNAEKLLGSAIERREDPALVSGDAEYTDDIKLHHMVHMAVVRSPHAHARIQEIDTSQAEEMEGVINVFTAEDMDVSGSIPTMWVLDTLEEVDHPILADNRIRYQGDAIAIVLAEQRYQAHDAASAVDANLDPLEAVTKPSEAINSDAVTVHEEIGSNKAFNWDVGDKERTDEVFNDADTTVSLTIENQLLIQNAIEPRAAIADYNPSSDKLDVTMTTQNPHLHRRLLSTVIEHPEHKLSVRAPDVGGGFGSKIPTYPDEALTAWAAKQVERPVKWQATRTESYLTDVQARGHETYAEIALEESGDILGVRVETKANIGAYLSTFAPSIPTYLYAPLLSGQYEIPAIYCSVEGAFTNIPPVDAYRGAGRPEASFVIERLIKKAATELNIDPAEFRRQNFIPKDSFPYETPLNLEYDSGDYEKTLDKALEILDYQELRDYQEKAQEEGNHVGIGFSAFVESCGLAPSKLSGKNGAQVGQFESSIVRFQPSGTVTVYVGTSDHGQGHSTTYAQVVADKLGVDYEDIDIVEGDTSEIPEGTGTYGSRSAAVGGGAIVKSAKKVIKKGKQIAAHQMEAAPADIEFEDGGYQVAGAPSKSMNIKEAAKAANLAHDIPEDMEPGLEATSFFDPDNFVYPFGLHTAVVEVNPDTGEIEIDRYVAVDDVGNQINPKIVEGQIHGGIASGIGQAMYEEAIYDDNGQLLSGSMQDYGIPNSNHIPEIETESTVTPSPCNPLGVKGVGESGTIAAPQAIVNAVVDALEPFDIDHIDMPLTEERVWRAIHNNEGDD